jgi:pyruvate/2-oxoglutarate dehydrogenase complex dihydrolipoamide dehydrogenase (E3) component
MKRPSLLTRKTDKQFDLVVIGVGSAGAVAAKFAAEQLGLRVAAIEKGRIGGDCLRR